MTKYYSKLRNNKIALRAHIILIAIWIFIPLPTIVIFLNILLNLAIIRFYIIVAIPRAKLQLAIAIKYEDFLQAISSKDDNPRKATKFDVR